MRYVNAFLNGAMIAVGIVLGLALFLGPIFYGIAIAREVSSVWPVMFSLAWLGGCMGLLVALELRYRWLPPHPSMVGLTQPTLPEPPTFREWQERA